MSKHADLTRTLKAVILILFETRPRGRKTKKRGGLGEDSRSAAKKNKGGTALLLAIGHMAAQQIKPVSANAWRFSLHSGEGFRGEKSK